MKNDGVYLEKLFQDELKKIKRVDFIWRRLYDVKDHGGKSRVQKQPADFIVCGENPTHVELKSRKSRSFRLEKFTQYADMRRWALAGMPGYVVVHFYSQNENLYLVNVLALDPKKVSWRLDGGLAKVFKNMEELVNEF